MADIVTAILARSSDPNYPAGWVETSIVDPALTMERVRDLLSAVHNFACYGQKPEWRSFPLQLFISSMVGSYYNDAEVAALVMALNTVLSTPTKIDQTLEYHWPPASNGRHWAQVESQMDVQPWWYAYTPDLLNVPPDKPVLPLQPCVAYSRSDMEHRCVWFSDPTATTPHFRQFSYTMNVLEFSRSLYRMKVYDNPSQPVYDALYPGHSYSQMWVLAAMTQPNP